MQAFKRQIIDVTSQLELENIFSKHQLISRIHQESADSNFIPYLVEFINVDFGLDLLTQMVLHNSTTEPKQMLITRQELCPKVCDGVIRRL